MNDKTKKKDLPGNLNKTEFDLLLESLPKEEQLELRKKRIEILRQGLKNKEKRPKQYNDYGRSGKENPKKSTKDGDVISGGKVLPTMEAAKGGMVKKYKHGGSVKKNTMATTKGWGISRKT